MIHRSPPQRPHPARTGLTLMELVVVLAILAGLAAILVPLFPNLLRRTHKATDATQTAEVAKAVQLYQASYVSYPDQFDLLTDGTATPIAYLPGAGSATGAFGGAVTFGPLSGANGATVPAADALGRVGIAKGWTLATATTQPTLAPYDPAAAATALSGSTNVAVVNNASANIPAELKQLIARDPTARFVVFGVGQRCTMVGKVMMNAPTSVPQEKGFTPDNTYCRVGVIFLVAGAEVEKTERARFVLAVALEDDELESTEKDVVGYYNVSAQ